MFMLAGHQFNKINENNTELIEIKEEPGVFVCHFDYTVLPSCLTGWSWPNDSRTRCSQPYEHVKRFASK